MFFNLINLQAKKKVKKNFKNFKKGGRWIKKGGKRIKNPPFIDLLSPLLIFYTPFDFRFPPFLNFFKLFFKIFCKK